MQFTWKENHMESDLEFGKLKISDNNQEGFLPEQLLISSIAGCSAYFFDIILKKQKVEFDYLVLETEVKRDSNNKIEKILLNFIIEGGNLNEEKLLKNLKLSHKHCGMVQSVKDSIIIEDQLTIK